jgi:hypothetical protein
MFSASFVKYVSKNLGLQKLRTNHEPTNRADLPQPSEHTGYDYIQHTCGTNRTVTAASSRPDARSLRNDIVHETGLHDDDVARGIPNDIVREVPHIPNATMQ